jgi:hypothetical protein
MSHRGEKLYLLNQYPDFISGLKAFIEIAHFFRVPFVIDSQSLEFKIESEEFTMQLVKIVNN